MTEWSLAVWRGRPREFSPQRGVCRPGDSSTKSVRRIKNAEQIQTWKTWHARSMHMTLEVASSLRPIRFNVSSPGLMTSNLLTTSRTPNRHVSSSRNALSTSSGRGARSSRPYRNLCTTSQTFRRASFTLSHSLLHASTSCSEMRVSTANALQSEDTH